MLLASTTNVFALVCPPHNYSTSSSRSTQYLYSHQYKVLMPQPDGSYKPEMKNCSISAITYKYKTKCTKCSNVSREWEESAGRTHSSCGS